MCPHSLGQGPTHHSSRRSSFPHGTCTYGTPQRAPSTPPQTWWELHRVLPPPCCPRSPSSACLPLPEPRRTKGSGDAHSNAGRWESITHTPRLCPLLAHYLHVDAGSQLQHVLQPPGHLCRAGAGMSLPPVVQPARVVLGVHLGEKVTLRVSPAQSWGSWHPSVSHIPPAHLQPGASTPLCLVPPSPSASPKPSQVIYPLPLTMPNSPGDPLARRGAGHQTPPSHWSLQR